MVWQRRLIWLADQLSNPFRLAISRWWFPQQLRFLLLVLSFFKLDFIRKEISQGLVKRWWLRLNTARLDSIALSSVPVWQFSNCEKCFWKIEFDSAFHLQVTWQCQYEEWIPIAMEKWRIVSSTKRIPELSLLFPPPPFHMLSFCDQILVVCSRFCFLHKYVAPEFHQTNQRYKHISDG